MEGVITTADSKADGRLKASVANKPLKKGILKKLVGRGGPGLSGFKPVGYGKMSFPKVSTTRIKTGTGKKIKLPSIASLTKTLLKGSKSSGSKLKLASGSSKVAKLSKVKKMKLKTVKGLVTSYR